MRKALPIDLLMSSRVTSLAFWLLAIWTSGNFPAWLFTASQKSEHVVVIQHVHQVGRAAVHGYFDIFQVIFVGALQGFAPEFIAVGKGGLLDPDIGDLPVVLPGTAIRDQILDAIAIGPGLGGEHPDLA